MSLTTQYFDSFDQWVSRASSWLTCHSDYNDGSVNHYNRFTAICFDTKGRICRIGADFMRARDEGTFPIRWIWPDQVPELALAATSMTAAPEAGVVAMTSPTPSEERDGLVEPRRMDAYYYSFDPTGVDLLDKVLSSVALAGKAFHHTEDWNDQVAPSGDHTGGSPAEWIQNAANEAAAGITRLRAEVEHWKRQAEAAQKNATLFQQDCAFHVAEKARKDAALKPFADEAAEWDDGHEYGEDQFIGMESEITVGDLRAARAARGPAEGRAALEQEEQGHV